MHQGTFKPQVPRAGNTSSGFFILKTQPEKSHDQMTLGTTEAQRNLPMAPKAKGLLQVSLQLWEACAHAHSGS